MSFAEKQQIGWREWAALPELSIKKIKAKIDTGARTSALHADQIEYFRRNGSDFVRFIVYPEQRNTGNIIRTEAPLLEKRNVKSSSGHSAERPVIITRLKMGENEWPVELTLADRRLMGFRMLIGRQALMYRFIVDPSLSFVMQS